MQRYDFFANISDKWLFCFVEKKSYLCQLFLTDKNETKQHKIRLCVSKYNGLFGARIM